MPRLYLREWRKFRDMTQEQLAEQMELTKGFISQLENGKERWNATHLARASRALRCEPAELLTIDPSNPGHGGGLFDRVPADRRAEAVRAVRALLEAFSNGETPA